MLHFPKSDKESDSCTSWMSTFSDSFQFWVTFIGSLDALIRGPRAQNNVKIKKVAGTHKKLIQVY